jgi:hypothetical protein
MLRLAQACHDDNVALIALWNAARSTIWNVTGTGAQPSGESYAPWPPRSRSARRGAEHFTTAAGEPHDEPHIALI